MKLTHKILKATMLSTISVASLGLSSIAYAQDEGATEDAAAPAEEEFADAEIVVTATGRPQAAQDIPIAVNVVAAEQIENAGISDIRGINKLAPSLQTTTGQSAATGVVLRIRGIGTAGDNPGFEPAVGVFIDGVLRARAGVALSDLPPLDRVEVLRGPQGTLFGRNTSAGALNIITAGPEFDLGGYVEASYGNLDEIEVKAGITGPISEMAALRVDGGYHKRDGYIKDANSDRRFNDVDRWFVRGQGLFENDTITVRLIGDYAKTDEQCCGALNTGSGLQIPLPASTDPNFINIGLGRASSAAIEALAGNPLLGGALGRDGIVLPFNAKDRTMAVSPNRSLAEGVKEWGLSGQLDWDLGAVSLTSITAYRDWKATRSQDIDFSGLDRAYRDGYKTGLRDFTQELRLKGSAFDGKLDWLVGGFYLNERVTLNDTVRFGTQADQFVDYMLAAATPILTGGPARQLFGTIPGVPLLGGGVFTPPRTPDGAGQVADKYVVDTEALALFTHNIINFNDNISLTLGLRYNHETKDIDTDLTSSIPACAYWQNPATAPFRAGLGALFPLIHLYTCNPTVNSGFNGQRSDSRSESEWTGTAKLSVKLNEDMMVYGGYDRGYKSGGYNLDRGSFDSVLLGGNGAQLTDLEFGAETADVYEIGLKTNFTRQFQFNIAAFHSTFHGYQNNSFVGTRFQVQNFDKVVSKGVEIESIIRPASDLNIMLAYSYIDAKVKDPLAGNDNRMQLTNTPKHSITGAVTWTPQLTDNIGGLVHVDWRVNSDANTINSPLGIPFTTNDGYGIVNAKVGVNFGPDGNYAVEGYVENLFNTYYNITAFPIPEQGSSFAVYPSPPRFYGVRVKAKF